MKRFQFSAGILAFWVLAVTTLTHAQSDYMPPMTGWPAAIQTAWQIQGEYYGSQVQDPSVHVGAWIVANGGTSFGLVVLPGGLLALTPSGSPTSAKDSLGGWDQVTRYQNGTTGPIAGTLNGSVYRVTTTTG